MSAIWKTIRRFLTAEEVPRWFGLSVVLTYLVGLGSVAQFGISQARREGATEFRQTGRYAAKSLAEQLSAQSENGTPKFNSPDVIQRELREFAVYVPARVLRVVDDQRRVVASTIPAEHGQVVTDGAEVPFPLQSIETNVAASTGSTLPDTFVRIRLGGAAATESSPLYLEAILPGAPYPPSGVADQASMFAVILVVLGALFVMHRCLREQLRGVTRIADRLHSHRDRLKDELDSLRIADTLDGVTTAWNELVELTKRSLETVHRTEADQELSRALQHTGGGALAEALNAVPDGIVYLGGEGRFNYINAPLCHLFGWTPQEAKDMTLDDARAKGVGSAVLDLVRSARRPDGRFESRHEVIEGDEGGHQSAYRVRIIPLQRDHHHGECVAVIRDVSQQIRAERAREEFITQVTHELRTPLTNIRAYTETLSSGMFDDPKLLTECYNVITKETRRLSRLVEDILSVSQLEVGTIELKIDDVDLRTLLTDSVRDVRGLADEKNIDLRLVLSPKMEPIRADRDKLAVVINNLLGNAIKYTAADGNVVVGCQFTAGDVTLTVKDNGMGIDPADQARIFEKFQRANDPAVKDIPGTGIGLYTAREIVRRHRGEIEVISGKGQGSTFLVRLPHQGSRAAAMSTAKEL